MARKKKTKNKSLKRPRPRRLKKLPATTFEEEVRVIREAAKAVSTPNPDVPAGRIGANRTEPPQEEKPIYEQAHSIIMKMLTDRSDPEIRFSCPPIVWEQQVKQALAMLLEGCRRLDAKPSVPGGETPS